MVVMGAETLVTVVTILVVRVMLAVSVQAPWGYLPRYHQLVA